MFKFGIHNKEQLTPRNLKGFFARRKFIAMDIYNDLGGLPPADRNHIQERMLGRFSMENGTFKYTHNQRFTEFDQLALQAIKSNCPADRPVRVHDIGVSDGRTSCDLYNQLEGVYGVQLDFFASDYAPFVYVIQREGSKNRLIVDGGNALLQIITPPFVFNTVHPESRWLYPLNHAVRWIVTVLYARPLLKNSARTRKEKVELLCQECRDHMAAAKNFHFEVYDVLSGPKMGFDVIRVMNVLNYSYFSEAQLKQAIENVSQSLNEDGLFITGSNVEQGTVVNGGIYKKSGSTFMKIAASGSDSQVDSLICPAMPSAAARTGT